MTRLMTNSDKPLDRITRIMTELALNDVDRNALAREFDRVRVA